MEIQVCSVSNILLVHSRGVRRGLSPWFLEKIARLVMKGLKHIFVYIPNPLQYRHNALKIEPNTKDSALVSTFFELHSVPLQLDWVWGFHFTVFLNHQTPFTHYLRQQHCKRGEGVQLWRKVKDDCKSAILSLMHLMRGKDFFSLH